jgi:hypothetical protein
MRSILSGGLRRFCVAGAVTWLLIPGAAVLGADDLERHFLQPPPDARPWVYWFWKNGNISREGITADLEAMDRVGIGGVILMEVALTTPRGPVRFFSEPWRELFAHAVAEADRLGLKISMNSAPGWTGSGGPWVTPEQSMQKVVASETNVSGPRRLDEVLPQPETLHEFYRDIAVLAFPTPQGEYRVADFREKALYQRGPISSQPGVRPAFPAVADYSEVPSEQVIPKGRIVDLTKHMDASGRLAWDVPAGAWTILRFGHTSTGQTNRPAPLLGLECDKLDTQALDAHFRQFTARLLADVGPRAGNTLVATHLDSWEVGAQNWTARFRQAFRRRRGYDPLGYLPVMTGRVVESLEVSERFLWDLRQTVSEMIAEKHGRHMHRLAHRHGLWLSIEPYDMTPCDDMTLGATADVPMCEFWSQGFDTRYSVKEATSVGHVYAKGVVGAEAFTSGSRDAWRFHPATVKALGDWAFCEGVNRFVIHRYAHQPFMQIRPGFSLGPHGLHYERTQTWWELSRPWHEYLARCQHLLRRGRWVADVLYLSPEGAPNVFQRPDPEPVGHKYDACTPEALFTRLSVKDGTLVLPDGMTYRLLVMPEADAVTPALLRKIKDLAEAGATIVGNPPRKSPSLSGHPHCDHEVKQLAAELWGKGPAPAKITERPIGKGRIVWGGGLERPPREADDTASRAMGSARWIWHREGNPAASAPVATRYFRRTLSLEDPTNLESARAWFTADNAFELWVNGRRAGAGDNFHQLYPIDVASLLRPGRNLLAIAATNGGDGDDPNPAALVGSLVIRLRNGRERIVPTDGQWQSAQEPGADWTTATTATGWSPAMELGRLGMRPWGTPAGPTPKREIYPPSERIVTLLGCMGVLPDFAADKPLRYAHRQIGEMDLYFVSNGEDEFVEAACTFRVTGKRPELWHPETGRTRPLPSYSFTEDGRTVVPLRFEPTESYFVVFGKGITAKRVQHSGEPNFRETKPLLAITGPWRVTFDPEWGGPDTPLTFERLDDWSERPEQGIRHYSGTAVYRTTFKMPAKQTASNPQAEARNPRPRVLLDLGVVHELAQVRLNGKDLGIAWKRPFRVDLTDALRAGANELEIRVTNLWPNRLIGDESLPPDSDRNPDGTHKAWPQWLLDGESSPTGRYTFATWQPYKKSSPLLPSGLFGPVTLQAPRNGRDL